MRSPVPPDWKVSLPDHDRSDGGGRPTSLTNDVATKIITALRLGAHEGPAAEYAGIPSETMSRWMHRDTEPYVTFQRKVREAEAFAELKMVGIASSTRDATEALNFLERRFPRRWARVPAATAQANFNVTFDLGNMLDKIEKRRQDPNAPRDPRPARVIEHRPALTNGHEKHEKTPVE